MGKVSHCMKIKKTLNKTNNKKGENFFENFPQLNLGTITFGSALKVWIMLDCQEKKKKGSWDWNVEVILSQFVPLFILCTTGVTLIRPVLASGLLLLLSLLFPFIVVCSSSSSRIVTDFHTYSALLKFLWPIACNRFITSCQQVCHVLSTILSSFVIVITHCECFYRLSTVLFWNIVKHFTIHCQLLCHSLSTISSFIVDTCITRCQRFL